MTNFLGFLFEEAFYQIKGLLGLNKPILSEDLRKLINEGKIKDGKILDKQALKAAQNKAKLVRRGK